MDRDTARVFAKKVGMTVHTLQGWDGEEALVAQPSHTHRRYYTDNDFHRTLGKPQAESWMTNDQRASNPAEPHA